MTGKARIPYSPEVRSQALALAAEVGFVAAGAQLSLNPATIRSWASRATRLAPGVDSSIPWSERRGALLEAFGLAASEGVEAVRRAIRAGKASDARSYAIAAGISHDHAALLAGEPTSRTEGRSASLQVHAKAEPGDLSAVDEAELDETIRVLRAELAEGGSADG